MVRGTHRAENPSQQGVGRGAGGGQTGAGKPLGQPRTPSSFPVQSLAHPFPPHTTFDELDIQSSTISPLQLAQALKLEAKLPCLATVTMLIWWEGYYDAGDNVKFGFPMTFTTTMLSWSVIEFGGLMKKELQNAKAAIRWATDYLLKANAHPSTIYVQVGDAGKDHACWERPEDMDNPRNAFKI